MSTHESADQAGTPQYGTAHSAASAAPHYSAAFGSTSLPGSQPVSAQEYDAVLRRLSAAEATRDNMQPTRFVVRGEKNRKLVDGKSTQACATRWSVCARPCRRTLCRR